MRRLSSAAVAASLIVSLVGPSASATPPGIWTLSGSGVTASGHKLEYVSLGGSGNGPTPGSGFAAYTPPGGPIWIYALSCFTWSYVNASTWTVTLRFDIAWPPNVPANPPGNAAPQVWALIKTTSGAHSAAFSSLGNGGGICGHSFGSATTSPVTGSYTVT